MKKNKKQALKVPMWIVIVNMIMIDTIRMTVNPFKLDHKLLLLTADMRILKALILIELATYGYAKHDSNNNIMFYRACRVISFR